MITRIFIFLGYYMGMPIVASPKKCIEPKPTKQSIWFAGECINLSEIARITSIYPSHLSRIFRGERNATLRNTVAIADALGMPLDSFVSALTLHVRGLAA